jgi:WD40 repeat protein
MAHASRTGSTARGVAPWVRVAVIAAGTMAALVVSARSSGATPKLLVDTGEFTGDAEFQRQIAITRDDRWLVVSDVNGGIAFYDVRSGKLTNRLPGHAGRGEVSYQPVLDRLVTTGGGTIKIWDVAGQRLERTVTYGPSSDFVGQVYLDPTGRFLFGGAKFVLPSGRLVKRFRLKHMFFFGDRYILSDEGGTVEVFRIKDDRKIASFHVPFPRDELLGSIHFDERRRELYYGFSSGFVVRSLADGKQGRLSFARGEVEFADSRLLDDYSDSCVTSDGRSLLSVSSMSKQLVILEKIDPSRDTFIDNAREVHREPMASARLVCLTTRPQVVVYQALSSQDAGKLVLYDVPTHRVLWTIESRLPYASRLALDRPGKRVAVEIQKRSGGQPASRWFAVGLDGDFRPQEIKRETFSSDFFHPGYQINEAGRSFMKSPSGRFAAVPRGDGYGRIDIVDLGHGNGDQQPLFTTQVVNAKFLTFSPDEEHMAIGGFHDLVSYDLPSRHWERVPTIKEVSAIVYTRDGKSLVCGTSGNEILILDAAKSTIVRRIGGFDGGVVDLAITADDRLLVSIAGDKGLRFWDLATGKLLSTAFFDANLDYVALTPQGYFDKSAKFDRLIWNIDGVPVALDQYYETFYRPQLVRAAMLGSVDTSLPSAAAVGAPPSVRIVRAPPETREREMDLEVAIKDQGGGVGSVRIYDNGTAVKQGDGRGISIIAGTKEGTRTFRVSLSAGDNRIEVIAFNADDTVQSQGAVANVRASYGASGRITLHALIIGIEEYENPDLRLKYPRSDAELFAETLAANGRALFGEMKLTVLKTRAETTRKRIESTLESLQSVDPNDLFVFYVASHGLVDNGVYYLLTSNVGSLSSRHLESDALSHGALANLLMKIPAQKKLVVVDTCGAGALGNAIQLAALGRGLTESTAMKVLSRAVGTTVLAASAASQQALEGYQGHGLFTFLLAEGLRGRADLNRDAFVKTTELADFIDDEVPALAEKVFGHRQFPTVSPGGMAFPIARVGLAP